MKSELLEEKKKVELNNRHSIYLYRSKVTYLRNANGIGLLDN